MSTCFNSLIERAKRNQMEVEKLLQSRRRNKAAMGASKCSNSSAGTRTLTTNQIVNIRSIIDQRQRNNNNNNNNGRNNTATRPSEPSRACIGISKQAKITVNGNNSVLSVPTTIASPVKRNRTETAARKSFENDIKASVQFDPKASTSVALAQQRDGETKTLEKARRLQKQHAANDFNRKSMTSRPGVVGDKSVGERPSPTDQKVSTTPRNFREMMQMASKNVNLKDQIKGQSAVAITQIIESSQGGTRPVGILLDKKTKQNVVGNDSANGRKTVSTACQHVKASKCLIPPTTTTTTTTTTDTNGHGTIVRPAVSTKTTRHSSAVSNANKYLPPEKTKVKEKTDECMQMKQHDQAGKPLKKPFSKANIVKRNQPPPTSFRNNKPDLQCVLSKKLAGSPNKTQNRNLPGSKSKKTVSSLKAKPLLKQEQVTARPLHTTSTDVRKRPMQVSCNSYVTMDKKRSYSSSNQSKTKNVDYDDDDDDEEEEEDEEEDDMEGFIVDDDDDCDDQAPGEISATIKSLFRYDRSRVVRDDEDDDDCMETSYQDIVREEKRSARLGLMEDLEDVMREEEERAIRKKRKHK